MGNKNKNIVKEYTDKPEKEKNEKIKSYEKLKKIKTRCSS
jgi:hypothetical protein